MIRIVLADSEDIYRGGIQKIFAVEDDIQVIAQADSLAGLHGTIQRFPTDMILLVESKLIASTVDAIPELLRRAPKLKIVVQSAQNDESNTVKLYRQGVQGIIPRSNLARPAGQVRTQDCRRRNLDRQPVHQQGD